MKGIKLINFIDLTNDEKKMILEWRNNPDIKKWMYTEKDITFENHLNFLDNLKISTDKLYFLVKKDNTYSGVIYFINLTRTDAHFGLYSNPSTKIFGIGRILEEISINFAFNSLKIRRLKLEVFEENVRVINLHKKYNFKKSGEKFVNNKKVICMELNCENLHSCSNV